MGTWTRSLGLTLAGLSIVATVLKAAPDELYPQGTIPRPLPVEKLWNTEAAAMSWEKLKGRVIFLDFWSHTCGPCILLMPELIQFRNKHSASLEVIGYFVGGRETDCDAVVKKQKLPYPVVYSPGWSQLFNWRGTKGLPMVVLVDRKGKVRYGGLRPAEAMEKALQLIKE